MDTLNNAIEALANKAKNATLSDDAMQFAQATLNLAQAAATLHSNRIPMGGAESVASPATPA